MKSTTVGTIEMVAAMLISGTIGYFVVISELPILNVVWFRCLLGAITLFAICWMLGYIKPEFFLASGCSSLVALAGSQWLPIGCCYSHLSPKLQSPSLP